MIKKGIKCFMFVLMATNAWCQPKILVSTDQYNFGKIAADQITHGRVMVSNIGDKPLTFSTNTSCGCTTTVIGKATILPGCSTNVDVHFNSKGQQGQFFKSLVILSNDPTKEFFLIKLMGEVVVDIHVEPNPLYLMDSIPGTVRSGVINLMSTSGKPIKIKSISNSDNSFIQVQPLMQPEGLRLDVHFLAKNIPFGQRQGTSLIQIYTDSELQPIIPVSIVWGIKSSVLAKPDPVAAIGVVGKELRIPIELSHREGRAFKINRCEYIGEGLVAECLARQSSSHQSCTLVAPSTLAAGRYTGTLDLFLDDPDQAELKLRVAIVIQ